jgi:hypothetical protein
MHICARPVRVLPVLGDYALGTKFAGTREDRRAVAFEVLAELDPGRAPCSIPPLMWYTAQEWVSCLVGRLAICEDQCSRKVRPPPRCGGR